MENKKFCDFLFALRASGVVKELMKHEEKL